MKRTAVLSCCSIRQNDGEQRGGMRQQPFSSFSLAHRACNSQHFEVGDWSFWSAEWKRKKKCSTDVKNETKQQSSMACWCFPHQKKKKTKKTNEPKRKPRICCYYYYDNIMIIIIKITTTKEKRIDNSTAHLLGKKTIVWKVYVIHEALK